MGSEFGSGRLRALPMSPTFGMARRAAALRAQGRDVITLSRGEPDFPTPEHVIEAAGLAARQGFTHYTAPDGGARSRRP